MNFKATVPEAFFKGITMGISWGYFGLALMLMVTWRTIKGFAILSKKTSLDEHALYLADAYSTRPHSSYANHTFTCINGAFDDLNFVCQGFTPT